jgi:hypothetical protein
VYGLWGIYGVANLILLCSLKTYLSFETWKQLLQENMDYLIHLFCFWGRHRSTHCFKYLGRLSNFFNTFFFLFFMNNFSAIKLLRDNNKNLEPLFRRYPIGYIFGVCSQCRGSAYVSGVYVILILRAWQTSHKASTKLDLTQGKAGNKYEWKFSYSKYMALVGIQVLSYMSSSYKVLYVSNDRSPEL